jgi:hypothetical protein
MMLVRTDAGYEPMPVARYNRYVWDQPLHPEREVQPEAEPARPHAPAQHANGNGHANGHSQPVRPPQSYPGMVRTSPPQEVAPPQPVAPEQAVVLEEPVAESVPLATPARAAEAVFAPEPRATISKKAVALGIALVLGLPFGGKIVGLVSGGPSAAPAAAPVAGAVDPVPLVPARSGFTHAGPDAVRYAVVLKNPNKGFQASAVTVSVVFHDARGRLVGRATEGLSVVPAAGVTGVAGTIGVAAPASRMTVSVGRAGFQETTPAKPFAVRGVRLSRSGGSVVVRAGVSGVEAVRGARVVAVHLDKAGRVVGGDFTFVDVPRSPAAAAAVISTAGVPRSVTRVEVFVLR